MAPPSIQDEDLDDLDDVLDAFSAPSSSTAPTRSAAPASPATTTPAAASSTPPPPPAASGAATTTSRSTAGEEDFPDPDDDALPGDDPDLDGLDPHLARELEQGMAALFAGLGPAAAGNGNAAGAEPGQEEPPLDEGEFRRVMGELLRGELGGDGADLAAAGLPQAGTDGSEAEVDPKELEQWMKALGLGGNGGGSGPLAETGSVPGPKAKAAAPPPPPPANFQDAIAASMSKLKDSSASASAAASSTREGAGAGAGGGMAGMLAQLAGMPDLGDLESEDGLQGMLDEMMKQLMSREMLYEPLKELSDKYPAYLAQHRASLAPSDLERYEKQQAIVGQIVAKFEEPGAAREPPLSAQEEEERQKRLDVVVDLVAKMNECGAPPSDIMGEMPPGMELGADGVPKIPECVVC